MAHSVSMSIELLHSGSWHFHANRRVRRIKMQENGTLRALREARIWQRPLMFCRFARVLRLVLRSHV